ncbi:MAG: zinc-dependent metalloprotease [Mycobacteriaceae bacterium]|nr:zinc-dependent metalloprotease [Mycobacteriaceae bacterium]
MSNMPFGFSGRDDDSDRPGDNPFDPAAGFDPAALGRMLTEFGQMLSNMGEGGGPGGGSGPVNYDVAKQLARRQLGSTVEPVSPESAAAVAEAAHLAELWLDAATTLPAGATKTVAWTANDWLENTIDTWKRLCDPVAQQVSGVWTNTLPDEARDMAGPMLGMLVSMGGYAFGSQLGQALGQLAQEVLTSTDVGLPLGPAGTAALLPAAIAEFGSGLEQDEREILVFLAAREAAHQRLFHHVPWLRQRLLGAVEDYARGIKVDFSAIEEAAAGIDPAALQDPSKLEELLAQNAFEPQTTPEQKQALERLETMLALIEGWVETVVTEALGERLPGVAALTETLRRRRATGGPAEQTFATLVGLELRPRKLREAGALWRTLTEQAGLDGRDGVWAHPDLLPDSADLDDPTAFIAGITSGEAGFDPIAALEETQAREREAQEKKDRGDDKPDSSSPE